jgi:hypothetical protein
MAEEKSEGKLDKILAHLDSQAKRMDAMEADRKKDSERLDAACGMMDAMKKDSEERAKADAAKKDAEEKEREEKAKADAAKKDAEEKERADAAQKDAATGTQSETQKKMQQQIDALMRQAPAVLTPEMRATMVGYQSKAERVHQAFGDSAGAPPPVMGESVTDYRIRLLSKYQPLSKAYKDADLSKIGDEKVFASVEDAIYADALAEASNPSTFEAGRLIPIKATDHAGRVITRYKGDPNACWDQFNPPHRLVRRVLTPGSSRLQ